MSRDIKASKESIVKSDILIRVRVLHLLFVAIGLVILVRLLWVQLGSAEVRFNAERLKGRIFSEHEVLARRGSILSREGEPLATSIFCYQVQMDFGCEGFDSLKTYYEQSDSLSKLLSAYFGDRSAAEYRKFFRQQRAKNYQLAYLRDSSIIRSEGWFNRLVDRFRGELYVDIPIYDTLRIHTPVALFPRGVDYTEWLELKRYPILNWNMGMTYSLSESDERVYPQGELARRTIGKLMGERGSDYGIEKLCSLELSGQDGLVMRQRIARGFYGRVAGGEQQERVDGYDVVTTIDLDLQDVSDKALRRALERHDALWGTCIVMEVATGDILAMANLNRQSDGSYREEENHAIGARMEPGSTFKLAATIALLEDAKLSTSTTYDSGDGKYIKVGSTRVRDSHSGFKEVDMRTAFSNSLNGYFAQAVYEAYKDNPQQYTDFLRTLQIDSTKGFEVLGERKPRFPTPGSDIWWRHMTLVYMGYGYGVELSPLQTMSLYNAVANDGKMVAPRLLREIRRGDEVLREIPVRVLNEKICSQQTLDTVRSFLHEVTATGTGRHYLGQFKGFEVGAKTGTAQFAQGGIKYSDGYYLGSMIGYMPIEKPKYTVMTAIFTKSGRSFTIYGSGLAGEVERDVMQHIYNREYEWHSKIDTIRGDKRPEKIKGGNIESIRKISTKLSGNSSRTIKGKGWAQAQVDSLSLVEIKRIELSEDTVPSVYGMGLQDALFLLENRGFKVSVVGSGAVYRQSIGAGRRFKRGEEITITLR